MILSSTETFRRKKSARNTIVSSTQVMRPKAQ